MHRMLALRSLLELAAAWEDALTPGEVAPGWTSRPGRKVAVLPWHQTAVPVEAGWHLHHLCRWHQPHPGANSWEQATVAWITRAALLQDAEPGAPMTGPLPAQREKRQKQRAAQLSVPVRPAAFPAPATVDLDPEAFVRRVRLALSAVFEPALLGFPPQDVLRSVQGARSPAAALARLLPGVATGPAQALAERLRTHHRPWGWTRPDEGLRSARVAGPAAVRRSTWTAARAAGVLPHRCLAAEAAAGPLHLLVPGLQHAGPGSPALSGSRLDSALEEVIDLFTAVAALPAEQALPLPDLGDLLTGRGYLCLGKQARPGFLAGPAQEAPVHDDDWRQHRALALFVIPGLTEAVRALQAVQTAREQDLDRVRAEVGLATGLSEAELDEATGGERPFDRTSGDHTLERTLRWTGGIWSMVLARHPQDLVSDGRALSHCVGYGGYAQSVRAGRARIVRVLARRPDDERPVPLLTLELKPFEELDAPDPLAQSAWRLAQARGASNRLPTRDEATLIALWAREVGVRLDKASEVSSGATTSLRSGQKRLAVEWETVPVPPDRPLLPTSERRHPATRLLAETMAARWTPAATRTHQEGLRRAAALVERARSHLTTECLRLHAEGDARLVGTVAGDDLLAGTGVLTLAPDLRPRVDALSEPDSSRLVGLRIERQLSLELDADLQTFERRQRLDLRSGKRPGELVLQFSASQETTVNTYLSPAGLMNTGLLDRLHADDAWSRGVARRRQAGLTLLWSSLDQPLGELAAAASAVTRQPGQTLREQLEAWTGTATAWRSLRPLRTRRALVERGLVGRAQGLERGLRGASAFLSGGVTALNGTERCRSGETSCHLLPRTSSEVQE